MVRDLYVESKVDREDRQRHAELLDLGHRPPWEVLTPNQFQVSALDVCIGYDHRSTQRNTVAQLDTDGPPTLKHNSFHVGLGAHSAAVRLDHVDEVRREHLAAAPWVETTRLQIV